jgi:ATP-dependent protease ClpP protease subunit
MSRRHQRTTRRSQTDSDSDDSVSDSDDGTNDLALIRKVDRKTIFFYASVTIETVTKFNMLLKRMAEKLHEDSWKHNRQKSDDVISVFIHSSGGSMDAGLSAADHITHCSVKVRCIIDGDASSAATFMAVAATDTCLIMPHATMLVHQLRSFVVGTHSDLKDGTINCNKSMDLMRRLYLQKCARLKSAKLTKTLKNEISLLPEEAVEEGYCDAIFTGVI